MVKSFISCHPEMMSLFFLRCFFNRHFHFYTFKDNSVYKIKVFTNVFTLQFRTARRQVSIPSHFINMCASHHLHHRLVNAVIFYKSQKCLSALLVENCLLNTSICSTPLVIFNVFHETHTLRVVSHIVPAQRLSPLIGNLLSFSCLCSLFPLTSQFHSLRLHKKKQKKNVPVL